jgi:hypothetical protein
MAHPQAGSIFSLASAFLDFGAGFLPHRRATAEV